MTTQQKVLTVSNTDGTINAAIDAQAPDGWSVYSLTLSGDNIIILFYKTTVS